jgi:metal transporter CNNM
VSRRKG